MFYRFEDGGATDQKHAEHRRTGKEVPVHQVLQEVQARAHHAEAHGVRMRHGAQVSMLHMRTQEQEKVRDDGAYKEETHVIFKAHPLVSV